jgi:parallel beta-helix repeat protein
VGTGSRGLVYVGIAVLGLSLYGRSTVASGAPLRCDLQVQPRTDLRHAVNQAPEGARICFEAGTYRLHGPIKPRANQVLEGTGRATLLGSERLRHFRRHRRLWMVAGQGQKGERSGECLPGTQDSCQYPDAVFRDGHPLKRVMSRGDVGPGSFYLDYRHRRIFLGRPPRGHDLEAAVARAAVVARSGDAGAGVTVRGLRIEMFATPAQHGAIQASASGWAIEDNSVLLNHGAGIAMEQPVTVRGNRIARNGQEGIAGAGSRIVVTGNVISNNGWAGFNPGWEAGGAKWAEVNHLMVTGNTVTGNRGPGLWDDIDSRNVTYSGNTVTGNDNAGIFHEIGGRATIVRNRVTGNGFAKPGWLWGSGILLAASHDVVVAGNHLAANADGIGLIQQHRGKDPQGRPRMLHRIDIRENDVALGRGDTGLVEDTGDDSVFSDPTITYESNTYRQSRGKRFLWDDAELNGAQWRALGHDVDGTFLPG